MKTGKPTNAHLREAKKLMYQGRFSAAYDKAMKALAAGEYKEQTLDVLGDCAYGMRKWELAVQHYQELRDSFPKNEDAVKGLQIAKPRLDESRTGLYDFEELFAAASKGKESIEVGDYVGPVEIADIPGKDKGLRATADVKKGTLLLAAKAFVGMKNNSQLLAAMGLPSAVAAMLERHPEKAEEIAALYDGSERKPGKGKSSGILNGGRLARICKECAFVTEGFADLPSSKNAKHTPLVGLWILPSYINHSCLRNAHRTYYGDFMTIFAITDIKKGEEVTANYSNPLEPHQLRLLSLKIRFGFECDCRLCQLDRSDPLSKERGELVEKVEAVQRDGFDKPKEALSMLQHLLEHVDATYAKRDELQLLKHAPHKALGELYLQKAKSGSPGQALRRGRKIADCYQHEANEAKKEDANEDSLEMARKYARMAADLHFTRSGAGEEVFKKIYPNIADLI